jgi:hypothetical protein
MNPPPTPVGLTLCERIIIEEGTRNVTLVNCFSRLRAQSFPAVPAPFSVFAVLTNGHGDATIELVISRLDTLDEIDAQRLQGHFPARLAEVRIFFRVGQCSFPTPGVYEVSLRVDGDVAAARRLSVEPM